MAKWISVEDRLPRSEKNEKILIFVQTQWCGGPHTYITIGYYWNNNFLNDDMCAVGDVTHWMPLPEPPQRFKGVMRLENTRKAIKHFECVKNDAVAVLDSGFGTKPNESNIVYKNRKLYAELAINALEKQIPAKPVKKNPICYSKSIDGEEFYAYDYHCPQCDVKVNSEKHHCPCGQALDWNSQ